jgi:hypothetical protein
MSKQMINGDEVEVRVFAPDGTMEASLEGVESMRGMDEYQEGRYYLRYHSASGATEFWGYVSRKSKVDFKKGRVGVVVPSTA